MVTDSNTDVGPDRARVAFELLYRESYGRLMSVAMATVRDRALAEDMVHEAYAQLWVRWESITTPRAWVRQAVVSNCLDALRTRRRREAILRRTQHPSPPTNDSGDDAFVDLLVGLTDHQRLAVTLKYVEDLSEADIAQVMGCGRGTVKSTLHRAIAALRTHEEGHPS